MIRRLDMVYQLPRSLQVDAACRDSAVEWVPATPDTIHRFFEHDERRLETFLQHLKRGFFGVVLHEGDTWVTYAWMSRPSTLGPTHVPRKLQRLHVYWIFYCRTREAFRRRGFYRKALQVLIEQARAEDAEADIVIDTDATLITSRRAILHLGFVPRGVVVRYRLPKTSFTWGWWDKQREHPDLPVRPDGEL